MDSKNSNTNLTPLNGNENHDTTELLESYPQNSMIVVASLIDTKSSKEANSNTLESGIEIQSSTLQNPDSSLYEEDDKIDELRFISDNLEAVKEAERFNSVKNSMMSYQSQMDAHKTDGKGRTEKS